MKEVLDTLAKEHRIEILRVLETRPMGIYEVFKTINVEDSKVYTSVVERALKELCTTGLACRDEKKKFHVTAYGTYVLKNILEPLDGEVADYLKKKHIDLPEEFRKRIPLIVRNASIVKGMAVGEKLLKVQKEVKEEVFFILQKPLMSQAVHENNLDMVKRGVKIRAIWHKDNFKIYLDKEKMRPLIGEKILKEYNRIFLLNQHNPEVVSRFASEMKLNLYVADRKLVGIILPDITGEIRFDSGIMSQEPEAIKWGMEVFDYFWERSENSIQ